jgi:hypothetical protein
MDRNFQIGDVVTLRPACDCLALWRPLAEHLEGETFQVTGTARTIGWDVLVLQPWPCAEIYPSCQLAPAECLQMSPLPPVNLCQWDDVYDIAADAIDSIGARLQRRGIQLESASHGALQLALEKVLGEAEVAPLDPRLEQHLAEVG